MQNTKEVIDVRRTALLTNRKELERKAQEITEITDTTVRVNTVKGNIYIEMIDKELKNKREFIGDIDECNIFIEGILSFIKLIA